MTRMQNGFQALYPKKPEPANQSQYRNVNANSTGGMHPAYMAQSYKDFAAKSDPVLNRRSNNAAPRDPYNPLTARQPTAPFMVRPHGSTAGAIADLNKGFNRLRGSDPWADKVNRMDNEQLDQAVAPGVNAFRSRQSPASVASQSYPGAVGYQGSSANDHPWADRVNQAVDRAVDQFLNPGTREGQARQSPASVASNSAWSSVPNGIAVSQGSPFPVTPRGRVTSDGLNKLFHSPVPAIDMLGQVQGLSQTPRQNSGFSMDGPQQVSASVPPIGPSTPPLRRSDVPAWSLNGGVSPETERASQDFNRAAQAPRVNTGKIISDRITENMNNASIQGRQDANDIVDRNLNARMGFYSTPQARRGGFFQRGMGPMAGDASVMQRQSQPLSDGGPAAAAARANQTQRRVDAEAMMGPPQDGLTRYAVDPRLLQFANQGRMAQDSAMSSMLGGGSVYRQPMQAMTPSEIQFYRHKMNMASNPQYANRVMQQRADRQEMLDNRREMVRARRAGALEAAGASQQLRNLYAGRGGIGPGMDGVGALMSMGAQQDPAATMGAYGNVLRAQDAPLMQLMNYGNQSAMFDRQAQLERDLMDRATKMAIYSSGMSGPEQELALQRMEAANNGTPITSPLQIAGDFQADPSKSPMENYLAIQEYFDNARKTGVKITPEQERQIMMAKGINPSEADKQQWQQDSGSFFDTPDYTGGIAGPVGSYFIVNPLMDWLGLSPADQMRRKRMRERLQK